MRKSTISVGIFTQTMLIIAAFTGFYTDVSYVIVLMFTVPGQNIRSVKSLVNLQHHQFLSNQQWSSVIKTNWSSRSHSVLNKF